MRGIEWLKVALWIVVVGVVLAGFASLSQVKIEMSAHAPMTDAFYLTSPSHMDVISANVVVEAVTPTIFGPQFTVGSGVVVSNDGLILTAGHVLKDATEIRVKLHDGRIFDVNDRSTIYVDDKSDVAFIDLPCNTPVFKEVSSVRAFKKGDAVLLVGNPDGLLEDVVIQGTVVNCNLQRLAIGKNVAHLLVRMKVSPGCSGGGMYWNGSLIGIASGCSGDLVIALSVEECEKALKRYSGKRLMSSNHEDRTEYY